MCDDFFQAMRIDFIIGGTQKGGTSALASFLRQHPQIFMPDKKELHFFDREENFRSTPPYRAYHAHFRPRKDQRRCGEATPIYMYWESAPGRIREYNPQMKWIVILRDPAERAFSGWKMETSRGRESLTFEEAINQEAERLRKARPLQERVFSYIDRGFYAPQLRRLFQMFGREQCLIFLNEELRKEHAETLRRAFRFLDVDDTIVPAAANVFANADDGEAPAPLMNKLRQTFQPDVKEVEAMLERDLSSWYPR